MIFFDSHCHFDFADFDADRDAIWHECQKLGLCEMIIPGVSPAQWVTSVDIASRCQGIYSAAGLHPWWIAKEIESQDLDSYLTGFKHKLLQHLTAYNSVAVGECGLDALIDTPIAIQQQVFAAHLHIAQETKKPLIIHCRKAHNEILQQLKRFELPAGGVIHAFSGSIELAEQYWAMGFRLGIGGTITYERANKTRQAAQQIPLDAIVLETDAPDMPLQGHQGTRNSPLQLLDVATTLASLRSESLDHIATQTTRNAHHLFKIIH